ncbi:hypothetical protein QBC32DRAFT_388850 [Pseudoneurospora amorphoporcata]|uniref:Uncharacterized protein n=1 Tax=Pseudoneurospora amorphoporcata TaxID=241081 RepID=A0AAN6SGR6_9PEZI|nr:hypothetical protein QBC32DRAFT_388850 [Pseudoneurospora amorphoporcata]
MIFNVGRHIGILPETPKLEIWFRHQIKRAIHRTEGFGAGRVLMVDTLSSFLEINDYLLLYAGAALAHPALTEPPPNHAPRHSSGARLSVLLGIFPLGYYLLNISTVAFIVALFRRRAGSIADILFQAPPVPRACPHASRMCKYDLTSTSTCSLTTQSS